MEVPFKINSYWAVNFFIVKSNIESTSEIDGFSTDEEKDEELLNCEVDSTSR